MIRLLRFLIFGTWEVCHHKWKTKAQKNVYGDDYGRTTKFPIRVEYVLECEKCGNRKVFKS